VVGLAPIAEGDPRLWPHPDPGRYRRHLEGLAGFARKALAAGMIVRLFATDGPDQAAARALHAELAREAGPERLALEDSDTLPQLANILGRVDVVVAARLHAVLLAQLLGRPALALSYERKVATLMSDMGQDEFCVPLGDFEPERGFSLLGRLAGRVAELSASLRAQALERRGAVLAQYDRLFTPKREVEAA
jgi:polysaccharide pyruvyl transferase WcaK-like protein